MSGLWDPAAQIEWHEMGTPYANRILRKTPHVASPVNVHVMNEGFQRWDPAPKSAEAKVFLVITAEDFGDGAFTTQIVGLSLNGLKEMRKNGIQHVAGPTEKQRAIVNGCLENASGESAARSSEFVAPTTAASRST